MEGQINAEIQHRIGAARQAFSELRRPVFLNRHISCSTRLVLFHSLITSRLFYGAAVWTGLADQQIKRVEAALMRMIRLVIGNGFWNQEACVSDDALRAQFELPTFRVTLAKLRLTYLPAVANFEQSFYLDALHAENHQGQGWLEEVRHDLQWMHSIVDIPFNLPDGTAESWAPFLTQVGKCQFWQRLVNRAVKRHVVQEKIAFDTLHLHDHADCIRAV